MWSTCVQNHFLVGISNWGIHREFSDFFSFHHMTNLLFSRDFGISKLLLSRGFRRVVHFFQKRLSAKISTKRHFQNISKSRLKRKSVM